VHTTKSICHCFRAWVHIYTHVNIHIYIYVCVWTYIYIYIYIYICVDTCIYDIYVCLYIYIYTCALILGRWRIQFLQAGTHLKSMPLQHTATHCNTLQHTATHCNTLQHTATHCNTLQHTATHCNAGGGTQINQADTLVSAHVHIYYIYIHTRSSLDAVTHPNLGRSNSWKQSRISSTHIGGGTQTNKAHTLMLYCKSWTKVIY